MLKMIGISLIVLGLCALAWGGFSYKTREKIVDIGPIEATREKTHYIAVAPIAGGLALLAGVGLLLANKQ